MKNSIGIIIPFYNGWDLFEKCIVSLENQSSCIDQIVIGDDCSNDGSFEKLIDYSKRTNLNVIVFQNTENKGPGFTRKKALDYITTDYVAFCDCDDWYELDFVEKIKERIKLTLADLVIFDNYKIIGDRKEKANVTQALLGGSLREVLALYPMSLCRLVVSKEIIKTVNFPDLYNGEDGAVVPQIITRAKKIDILDEAFYNYYYRLDSASNKPSSNAYKGMIDAFSVVKQNIDVNKYNEEVIFLGVRFICYAATLSALKAKKSLRVAKKIAEAFAREYPLWYKNKYICKIGRAKKIYLFCVYKNWILACKLLAIAHGVIIKNG